MNKSFYSERYQTHTRKVFRPKRYTMILLPGHSPLMRCFGEGSNHPILREYFSELRCRKKERLPTSGMVC